MACRRDLQAVSYLSIRRSGWTVRIRDAHTSPGSEIDHGFHLAVHSPDDGLPLAPVRLAVASPSHLQGDAKGVAIRAPPVC